MGTHYKGKSGWCSTIFPRLLVQRLYGQTPFVTVANTHCQPWLNTTVTELKLNEQKVVLQNGIILPYDRLILATGARMFLPPIENLEPLMGNGCFVMRTADDALSIGRYIEEKGSKRALVVGGGLLGLEAAHIMHQLGLKVGVVEMAPHLMPRQLDAEAGALLKQHLKDEGIFLFTGKSTTAILGNDHVEGVKFADGRQAPSDLVLIATGIRSEIGLINGLDLHTNRGIVVDEGMQTSHPNIFAVGDVAEYNGITTGLWATAMSQAKVAAENAATLRTDNGRWPAAYVEPVAETHLKVAGIDVFSSGNIDAEVADEVIVSTTDESRRYSKLLVKNGRINGAILINRPDIAPMVSQLINTNVAVTPILADLRAGRWRGIEMIVN